MMGVGDKVVWLPSSLRTLARLQDIRVPKRESEIAESHLRFTSVYPQDTSLAVAVNFILQSTFKFAKMSALTSIFPTPVDKLTYLPPLWLPSPVRKVRFPLW